MSPAGYKQPLADWAFATFTICGKGLQLLWGSKTAYYKWHVARLPRGVHENWVLQLGSASITGAATNACDRLLHAPPKLEGLVQDSYSTIQECWQNYKSITNQLLGYGPGGLKISRQVE
jgi:hypothetical protein